MKVSEADVGRLGEKLCAELAGLRERLPPVVMAGPVRSIAFERSADAMRVAAEIRMKSIVLGFVLEQLEINGIRDTPEARIAVQEAAMRTDAWARVEQAAAL